jgi:hypothetical protein
MKNNFDRVIAALKDKKDDEEYQKQLKTHNEFMLNAREEHYQNEKKELLKLATLSGFHTDEEGNIYYDDGFHSVEITVELKKFYELVKNELE